MAGIKLLPRRVEMVSIIADVCLRHLRATMDVALLRATRARQIIAHLAGALYLRHRRMAGAGNGEGAASKCRKRACEPL